MAAPHELDLRTYLEQSQVGTMPGGEEYGRVGAIARHLVTLDPIPCLERKAMDAFFTHVSHPMSSGATEASADATESGKSTTYPQSGSMTAGRSRPPPGNP